MKPERYGRVKEIFASAVGREAGARAEFLARACAGDAELRAEVESLIEHDESAAGFIEESAFEVTARLMADDAAPSLAGGRIGAYKILREIGRGGMGVVYLAERDDDHFHKRAALKLIKRGMDTDAVVRRFRTERQILANLEHPNIARLLDGGATVDGLPYLVMEYVEGLPVADYCDERRLTTGERLQLFRTVCDAVQHAHQNLVVHRDIKPSNIIVTPDGVPKLLDFGIAKVLEAEQPDPARDETRADLRVLTPDYASPEQVRGLPVTTASDVYSLGVVLYELLTGQRPYHLKTHGAEELVRAICVEEPERPSQAVAGSASQGACPKDATPNPRLVTRSPKSLRGDLDNIVMKALRKEPERRYASAAQLSEDINRYAKGLPVRARADTFSYRASKFIGRNKIGVAAASLVLLAVLAGLTVSVWQARAARRERAKSEAVSSFLQTMLLASDPGSQIRERKNDATVRDILDEASRRLSGQDLSTQPEVRAALQRIIGVSYLSQGQYDLAEQNLTSALGAQRRIYGEDDLETLKTVVVLGELWSIKGDYAKADQFYRQHLPALRAARQRGAVGADFVMAALFNFALARRAQGDPKEAETLLREELALNANAPPDEKLEMDTVESVLALTLADQGKFAEAETMARAQVASIRLRSGDNISGAKLSPALTILAGALAEQGKLAEAEDDLREAETIYRKLYDRNFMPLGDNLRIQAQALYAENKYGEAEAKIDEALGIYRTSSGQGYINYPTALAIQGQIYSRTNRAAAAEKLLREAVEIRARRMPEAHFLRATADGALGEFLTNQDRFAEAEPLLLASYESLKISQSPRSPRTKTALQRIGALYSKWGRADAAIPYQTRLSENGF